MQQPSIGRTVHYTSLGSKDGRYKPECRAAIVTAITEDTDGNSILGVVDLCVLNPEGLFFNRAVPYEPGGAPGTWHWPERVP